MECVGGIWPLHALGPTFRSSVPYSIGQKNRLLEGLQRGRTTMFDAVKMAQEVEKVVCRGDMRKYYRFRTARFYGGIATADCVGCCLRCAFCWAWPAVVSYASVGKFYSPQQIAENLLTATRKKGFRRLRISGNEPTIGRDHLLKVLAHIPREYQFILETNGILIGHDHTYARDLASFPNLYVRVSLKGAAAAEFTRLTGAEAKGFDFQLSALENLVRVGVETFPAVMISFSSEKNVEGLRKRLAAIDPRFHDFEVEELAFYGDVEKRLRKANLGFHSAYQPGNIPPGQV